MHYKVYDLVDTGDDRGGLIPFEKGMNVPFEVRRAFYIFNTRPGTARGSHANRNSQFLFVVISGSCKVKIDNGVEKSVAELNRPNQALWLDKMVWKEMYDFSYNAILLVLSNEKYDENEYIRDYDDYQLILTTDVSGEKSADVSS
jgi:dTDP-4-dehydrorhamnose 3,5-epimerase-like enzyme